MNTTTKVKLVSSLVSFLLIFTGVTTPLSRAAVTRDASQLAQAKMTATKSLVQPKSGPIPEKSLMVRCTFFDGMHNGSGTITCSQGDRLIFDIPESTLSIAQAVRRLKIWVADELHVNTADIKLLDAKRLSGNHPVDMSGFDAVLGTGTPKFIPPQPNDAYAKKVTSSTDSNGHFTWYIDYLYDKQRRLIQRIYHTHSVSDPTYHHETRVALDWKKGTAAFYSDGVIYRGYKNITTRNTPDSGGVANYPDPTGNPDKPVKNIYGKEIFWLPE